jgi:hypothetical protein
MIGFPQAEKHHCASERNVIRVITDFLRRISVREGAIEIFNHDYFCPASVEVVCKSCFKLSHESSKAPDCQREATDELPKRQIVNAKQQMNLSESALGESDAAGGQPEVFLKRNNQPLFHLSPGDHAFDRGRASSMTPKRRRSWAHFSSIPSLTDAFSFGIVACEVSFGFAGRKIIKNDDQLQSQNNGG